MLYETGNGCEAQNCGLSLSLSLPPLVSPFFISCLSKSQSILRTQVRPPQSTICGAMAISPSADAHVVANGSRLVLGQVETPVKARDALLDEAESRRRSVQADDDLAEGLAVCHWRWWQ